MPASLVPLAGKAALVTGGSRSIGAAIAKRLAADGAAVAITFHGSPERAAQTVAAIEAAVRQTVAAVVGPNMAIGRYGEPEEIAAAVAFLASPEAALITGAELMADGGLSA